jgi:hypothetical protein
MSDKTKCKHCSSRIAYRRKLCYSCYFSPQVAPLYFERGPQKGGGDTTNEPTMAELDLMIAENYPTMPTDDGLRGRGRMRRKIPKRTKCRLAVVAKSVSFPLIPAMLAVRG